MSILDAAITGGFFALAILVTLFIRDDNQTPDVPEVEPSTGGIDTDDDLELSWSIGTGDWR